MLQTLLWYYLKRQVEFVFRRTFFVELYERVMFK